MTTAHDLGNQSSIDALIKLAYSGISEEPPWSSFAALSRQILNGSISWLFFHWVRRADFASIAMAEESAAASRIRKLYLDRFVHEDPIPYDKLEMNQIYDLEDFISRKDLEKSRYYRDFLHPSGLDYLLAVHFSEPSGFKLMAHFGRSLEAGPFTMSEREVLEALVPHLESALHLFADRQRMKLERDVSRDIMSSLYIGTITFDDERRIVDCNRAAKTLMATSQAMSIVNNALVFRSPTKASEFDEAFGRVLKHQVRASVMAVGSDTIGKGNLGLLLQPIGPFVNFGDRSLPSVVVYLNNASMERSNSAKLVAGLFDLTGAEANLAILLSQGQTISEAAERLCIAEGTARTCLKHIFSKTGVHRQAELVALVLQSVTMLAADNLQ